MSTTLPSVYTKEYLKRKKPFSESRFNPESDPESDPEFIKHKCATCTKYMKLNNKKPKKSSLPIIRPKPNNQILSKPTYPVLNKPTADFYGYLPIYNEYLNKPYANFDVVFHMIGFGSINQNKLLQLIDILNVGFNCNMRTNVDTMSKIYPNIKSYFNTYKEDLTNNPNRMIYCPENHSGTNIRFNKKLYINTYNAVKNRPLVFGSSVKKTLLYYPINYNSAYTLSDDNTETNIYLLNPNRVNIVIMNTIPKYKLLGMGFFPWDLDRLKYPTLLLSSEVYLKPDLYGKTIIHEMGHCFGLYHIFQSTLYPLKGQIDYNIKTPNDTYNDQCFDTKETNAKNIITNAFGTSYNDNKNNYTLGNYMDYDDDYNSFYFTKDQMFRMKYYMNNTYGFKS